jgi:hypothetical protein
VFYSGKRYSSGAPPAICYKKGGPAAATIFSDSEF